jgi:hypothetical protein
LRRIMAGRGLLCAIVEGGIQPEPTALDEHAEVSNTGWQTSAPRRGIRLPASTADHPALAANATEAFTREQGNARVKAGWPRPTFPQESTMRAVLLSCCLLSAASIACSAAAPAQETDGCSHFTWDVSHELALMKQTAKPVVASAQDGAKAPRLQVDALYELKLVPQGSVTYVIKPTKPALDDSTQGGLARFHVTKAGLYRVSITSGHWIDVVDADQLVKSKDFQGAHGCARPHKIVEFELAANRDLVLQLSGAPDLSVAVAITLAPTAPAQH